MTSCNCCPICEADLRRMRFCDGEDFCPCRLRELENLISGGFETYRLDPVLTSTKFISKSSCCCEIAGSPLYLKGKCNFNCMTYVILSNRCHDIVFELNENCTCDGLIYYTVNRYAVC